MSCRPSIASIHVENSANVGKPRVLQQYWQFLREEKKYWLTQDSSTVWVTPADPHPNGHANRLFAEHLLPRLEPMVSAATSPSAIASP